MNKKRCKRVFSIIFAVLLMLQFIPLSTDPILDISKQGSHNNSFISSGLYHTDILLTTRDQSKSSVKSSTIKSFLFTSIDIVTSQSHFDTISYPKRTILDRRKLIRQLIPHYFNGSKNKSNKPTTI